MQNLKISLAQHWKGAVLGSAKDHMQWSAYVWCVALHHMYSAQLTNIYSATLKEVIIYTCSILIQAGHSVGR